MKTKLRPFSKFILYAIFVLAGLLRLYNLNWDQGGHLHPDERAIVMNVVKLEFPQTFNSFLSPESPWNPHFFAYGSLPFYLLKIFGSALGFFDPLFAQYDLINIVGRFISSVFDLLTVLLVFYLGKRLHGLRVGYIGAFFYAVSVLPIQLSHFYAVDTMLTCLSLAVLYSLIIFYEKPSVRHALFVGIFFGLALATKISALVLLVSIGMALAADFLLLFLKQPHKPQHYLPHLPVFLRNFCFYAGIMFISAFLIYIVCEPYALLDFHDFWQQTMEQSQMTHNAFIFPYTLQYVGKIPYWYELKNIFLWGLGPLLATPAFLGIIYFIRLIIMKEKHGKWAKEVILLVFFLSYFLIVGNFAIGFMRYILPIYPLLCLFAAIFVYNIFESFKLTSGLKIIFFLYLSVLLLIWPVSFIQIYSQVNTRTAATQWIIENIPEGKTLAQEHWDDAVPLSGSEKYHILTLPLYDPDTPSKWHDINQMLSKTDYIIIASNRLYVPLQRLTNCNVLPQYRCYPVASKYYQRLFSGELGFRKIAEFTDYPKLPFLSISLDDQSADESFTVYDHPKILIFQKIQKYTPFAFN